MERRHLRYFIAAAETGSLAVAAEHRLYTPRQSAARRASPRAAQRRPPVLDFNRPWID